MQKSRNECGSSEWKRDPHTYTPPMSSEQIAVAAPKKVRSKAAPKTCGVPDCRAEVAAGAKLRLTVLEAPNMYPQAADGKLSTCKAHRKCVGFDGYSPEVARGTAIFQTCGNPAKVFYLGQSFCDACHNVYLEALVAQCKPRLSAEVIDVVRKQVVADNYTKRPEQSETPPADAATDALPATQLATSEEPVKAPAVKKAAVAASKKKAATAAAMGSEGAVVVDAKKPGRPKKTVVEATAAPPPLLAKVAEVVMKPQDDEAASESNVETPRMEVSPTPHAPMTSPVVALAPTPPLVAAASAATPSGLDEYEQQEEHEKTKPQPATVVVVKEPLKAAVTRVRKTSAAAAVAKA